MHYSSFILTAALLAGVECQRSNPQYFSNPGPSAPAGPRDDRRYDREDLPERPAPRPQSQPQSQGYFNCPDKFGFYPHSKSCDKYWACSNGTSTLKTCGNGLVFDTITTPQQENCAYQFSVDCGDRTDLEPPISTPNCPRLYGIFPHPNKCNIFYSCWNGEAAKYECPPGLAYDSDQRVCVWADRVDRCDQLEVAEGFVCPDQTEEDQPGTYTRHPHPTDCRKFYVCIENQARPYGCSFGTVFNIDTLQCDDPTDVPGCEKYYGDIDPKTIKKIQSGALPRN